MTDNKETLLPCPKCKSKQVAWCTTAYNRHEHDLYYYSVYCQDCGHSTNKHRGRKNKYKAEREWNTRADQCQDISADALCHEFAERNDSESYPFKGELYDIELVTFAFKWLMSEYQLVPKKD
jgi:hypothetical protein